MEQKMSLIVNFVDQSCREKIEYQINYGLFFFFAFFPPNALYDSDFKNRRVAVGEASSEALVKSFVISPNHLFTRSHTNHTATMKCK